MTSKPERSLTSRAKRTRLPTPTYKPTSTSTPEVNPTTIIDVSDVNEGSNSNDILNDISNGTLN